MKKRAIYSTVITTVGSNLTFLLMMLGLIIGYRLFLAYQSPGSEFESDAFSVPETIAFAYTAYIGHIGALGSYGPGPKLFAQGRRGDKSGGFVWRLVVIHAALLLLILLTPVLMFAVIGEIEGSLLLASVFGLFWASAYFFVFVFCGTMFPHFVCEGELGFASARQRGHRTAWPILKKTITHVIPIFVLAVICGGIAYSDFVASALEGPYQKYALVLAAAPSAFFGMCSTICFATVLSFVYLDTIETQNNT